MNKKEVIEKVEKAWADFHQAYNGLAPEQMIQPGVDGVWSVRDLLAHVSWWEDELLIHLPEILQGIRLQRSSGYLGELPVPRQIHSGLAREDLLVWSFFVTDRAKLIF